MVAWWTGDNTTADFFNTSNGLNSSPVSFGTGEVGAGFTFDGLQYTHLQIPRTDLLESMTTAVSVEAWVRSSTLPGQFKYIFSKVASNDAASYALYTGFGGGLTFYISNGPNFFFSPAASTTIWDGNWHFVVGTFDSSFMHLYVDGQEVGGGTAAPNASIGYAVSAPNDAYVGTFNGDAAFSFAGQVDEVAVSNRALAPSEIQAVFNAGSAGMCKSVAPILTGTKGKGYWQNKNGQGIIASGASTSGVCNSGAWLRQYAPFQDLSSTSSCSQVASYVLNVVQGGANMNAKLKAQMLATALSTYFSDPNLGGNKVGATNPIGGVAINIGGASVAFGGATKLTVSQMLAYAASQSVPGGAIWYGNVKAVQEQAKDTFEGVNSGTAFAP
jgi:hypothetical protein